MWINYEARGTRYVVVTEAENSFFKKTKIVLQLETAIMNEGFYSK